MKNALLIAAVTMMSASAFASKARMGALQNSVTTATDVQQIFEQPSKMWDVSDMATFEFGPAGTTYTSAGVSASVALGSPTVEGGFLRSSDNAKWGAYFGHQSTSLLTMLNGFPDASGNATIGTKMGDPSLLRMENPLNLFYGMKSGDMNWGFNLYYTASERKTGTDLNKKSAYGLSAGVGADKWNANLVVGLGAKVENNQTGSDSEEFKGNTSFKLAGEYAVNDQVLAYANATMFGGKYTATTGTETGDYDYTAFELGAESKVKSDIAHFYYGAKLANAVAKNKASGATTEKIEAMTLPVYFGLEADATSWLVLRTSLTQNVLLNSVKVGSTTPANDGTNNTDTTTGAAGFGLKFGKLMIDASSSVTGATGTGKLTMVDFGSNAALTYLF